MDHKKPRQFTDSDVAYAYKVVVEQVTLELLEEAGVTGDTDQELLDNLTVKGGHIQRHIIKPFEEMISLTMNDEITHVGQIWRDKDVIKHYIFTAEEIRQGVNIHGN